MLEKGSDLSLTGDGDSSEKRETSPGRGVILKFRVVGDGVGRQPIKGAPSRLPVGGEGSKRRIVDKSLKSEKSAPDSNGRREAHIFRLEGRFFIFGFGGGEGAVMAIVELRVGELLLPKPQSASSSGTSKCKGPTSRFKGECQSSSSPMEDCDDIEQGESSKVNEAGE